MTQEYEQWWKDVREFVNSYPVHVAKALNRGSLGDALILASSLAMAQALIKFMDCKERGMPLADNAPLSSLLEQAGDLLAQHGKELENAEI